VNTLNGTYSCKLCVSTVFVLILHKIAIGVKGLSKPDFKPEIHQPDFRPVLAQLLVSLYFHLLLKIGIKQNRPRVFSALDEKAAQAKHITVFDIRSGDAGLRKRENEPNGRILKANLNWSPT